MNKKRRLYLISYFLLLSCWIYCQPSLEYLQKLTPKDGLSGNSIFDLVIDYNGFLWVATSNGLSRYDGTEFKTYFAGNNPNSPSSNAINRLFLMDSMHMAIATGSGLNILDLKTGIFKKIFFTVSENSKYHSFIHHLNNITQIEKDKYGNIWIGTSIALMRLDSTLQLKKIYWSDYKPEDINKNRMLFVNRILPMPSGDVLIFLNNGNYFWRKNNSPGTDTLHALKDWQNGRFPFFDKEPPGYFYSVNSLLLFLKTGADSLFLFDEKTGRLASCYFPDFKFEYIDWQQQFSYLYDGWAALSFKSKGLALIKIINNNKILSIEYYKKHFFPNDNFLSITVDKENNLWARSAFDGLIKLKYQDQLFKEITLQTDGKDIEKPTEISSFLRKNNRIYIGTQGKGLYEWVPFENNFIPHPQKTSGNENIDYWNNTIWNLRNGAGDTIWIGTQIGLFWYHCKSGIYGRISSTHPQVVDSVAITTQFTDSYGLVWMGLGKGNGVCQFNPASNQYKLFPNKGGSFPYRYPVSIAEDSKSNIWFLNDNTINLVEWKRKTNDFIIKENKIPFAGTRGNLQLFIDDNDIAWMNLEGAGFICYNIRNGKIDLIGQKNNLPVSLTPGYFQDKSRRLWIASSGLYCFDPATNHFITYRERLGMPVENYSSPFYYDSLSGNLFVAAYNKIIYFVPEQMQRADDKMPVLITGIRIQGKKIELPKNKKIQLKWNENNVTVNFTGVNLTDGMQNRYAYKLAGGQWIDIGNNRQINFASLAPGSYDLLIRGAKINGNWSPDMAHMNIEIMPPFTGTIWFYLLCIIVIFLLIYTWYRIRLNHYIKVQKLRSHISRDLHDELGSKLTSISYMSLDAQNKYARFPELQRILDKINSNSIQISASLREIIWGVNPDADKFNRIFPRLVAYASEMLEMKSIELSIQSTDIPENLKLEHFQKRDFEMIFKEAINNIVKHAEASSVHLTLSFHGKNIHLSILDDGLGFIMDNSKEGNGLKNMESRAMSNHWKFEMNAMIGKGTELKLEIKTS